jgi:hypothetical protein
MRLSSRSKQSDVRACTGGSCTFKIVRPTLIVSALPEKIPKNVCCLKNVFTRDSPDLQIVAYHVAIACHCILSSFIQLRASIRF